VVRHGKTPIFDLPIASQDVRSSVFSNKFDALAAAFPILWPYGEGRWDITDHQRKLSFTEYVRWALQYHDRRFRTHHCFPFVAFGIEQKAKALSSAKLQMHRRDFDRDGLSLSTFTVEDLR
jgi:thiaminase